MRDEKETKGLRTILNFGHTLGHAVEAAGGYDRYHHGEAVALGMRMAADISVRLGYLSRKNFERINQVLSCIGLPERINGVPLEEILKTMQHDKKFIAGRPRFVLTTGIGKVKVIEGISLDIIREVIRAKM